MQMKRIERKKEKETQEKMTLNISIKWNGTKYSDIPLDTSQPALVFKTQIYTLTGVDPSRQKIMVKGGVLKV